MDLATYLNARYPVVYCVTTEERRVVEELVAAWPGQVSTWTFTRGVNEQEQNGDPEDILRKIREDAPPDSVWVLKDYHAFLGNPTICRAVRDLCAAGRVRDRNGRETAGPGLVGKQVHVVITSPKRDGLPVELQGDVPVVEYALPSRSVLQAIAATARKKLDGDEPAALADALAGLTAGQARSALAMAAVEGGLVTVPAVLKVKAGLLASSVQGLEIVKTDETLDNVAGLPALVAWIKTLRGQFEDPEAARAFGLPAPKGVLLVGVPGGGKSLTAKALAAGLGVGLLRLDLGAAMGSLVGQSENNIRQALKVAEAMAPAVLWADEIEKAVSQGQVGGGGDSGTSSRVIGTLITWLSEKTAPVFVVATANRPDLLPPEFMRKGRFDELFAIDLPDVAGRKAIFEVHLRKRARKAADFDLDRLAAETQGFVGAEIEALVVAGLRRCFVEGRRALTTEDLLAEAAATRPLSVTAAADIEAMRTWAKGRARNAAGEPTLAPVEGDDPLALGDLRRAN